MVVETRYAAGDGVLLGAGDHWVLVTDPRDDDVLEDVWAVLSGSRPVTGSVTEEVLATLHEAASTLLSNPVIEDVVALEVEDA